jgi:hypothetical protein
MPTVETRSITRDNLFMLASMWVENDPTCYRVKVRNLSAGGMMGEGGTRVTRGTRLTVDLQNVGAVKGAVAWVQEDRFGVAFDEAINSEFPQSA